jgi:sialidase-1
MKRLSLSLLLCALCAITRAEPFLEKQGLFTVGDDPAFKTYHIPGIVVTAKGTVLA